MASSRNAVDVDTSVVSDRSICRKEVPSNKEFVFVSSVALSNEVSTGGVFGWMAALFFFSVNFLLCGFLKSFSTIFSDVIDTVPPHLSWLLGQIGHLSLVCSPVTSKLISRYGYRPSVISAAALCSAGLVLSYFENSGETLIGRLSTILGVGVSFSFSQFVVCFGHPSDRPVARTIALSGGFLTAIVKPSGINTLLEVLGAKYTFLVFFVAISLCGLLLVPSRPTLSMVGKECCSEVRKSDQSNLAAATSFVLKRVLSLRFLADPTFFLTMASVFVMGMGYQHFLHYIPQQVKAFGVAPNAAMMLLSYAAVGDLVARLVYGVFSRRFSFTRSADCAVAFTISAAAFGLTTTCTSYEYFVVSAVLAGLGTGLWIVLLPLLLEANHGVENLESTYTLVRHFQMVVNLSYSPIAALL